MLFQNIIIYNACLCIFLFLFIFFCKITFLAAQLCYCFLFICFHTFLFFLRNKKEMQKTMKTSTSGKPYRNSSDNIYWQITTTTATTSSHLVGNELYINNQFCAIIFIHRLRRHTSLTTRGDNLNKILFFLFLVKWLVFLFLVMIARDTFFGRYVTTGGGEYSKAGWKKLKLFKLLVG